MGKNLIFETESQESEDSFIRRTLMGLLLGVAIGWVLLRYRRTNGPNKASLLKLSTDQEIEIPFSSDEDEAQAVSVISPLETQMKDRLEVIKGIGPVFAKRLHTAGIFTYSELANRTPEQLIEIVDAKPWQVIDTQAWITNAKALSK